MNIALQHKRATRGAEGLARWRFTVADVEAMVRAGILDEDERVELIRGELVPMSPKGSRHEVLKVALNRLWLKLCPDDVQIAQETTLRLSADTYLEPDFVIYPSDVGLVGIKGENVLLVVEVGDTSTRYDRGRKAKLYAQFGIRELWAIDAVKMTTRVFRRPSEEGYRETLDFRAAETMTPMLAPDAFALRLDRLKLV
jgi:Uma2 family endonuclease